MLRVMLPCHRVIVPLSFRPTLSEVEGERRNPFPFAWGYGFLAALRMTVVDGSPRKKGAANAAPSGVHPVDTQNRPLC